MGRSNVVLAIHHHNVLTSHRGGKNMSRFVMPHGATVFGATYLRKAGSRTEPPECSWRPCLLALHLGTSSGTSQWLAMRRNSAVTSH